MVVQRAKIKAAVIGMILGDASLSKITKKSQSHLSLANIQEDYVRFKASLIDSLTACRVFETPNNGFGKGGKIWRCDTRVHPLYTALRMRFYHEGRKTVDPHLMSALDPVGLSLWYLDDGTFNHEQKKVALATNCFNEAEHLVMVHGLWKRFGLRWDIHHRHARGKRYLGLALRAADREKFFTLVTPTVSQVSSMLYKLPTAEEMEAIQEGRSVRREALHAHGETGLLRQQYEEGASLDDVAQQWNMSVSAVRRVMTAHDIKRRSKGSYKRFREVEALLTEELLREEYLAQHRSILDIALRYQVQDGSIRSRLRRFGIPVRPQGCRLNRPLRYSPNLPVMEGDVTEM